jgi:hypothetical protein
MPATKPRAVSHHPCIDALLLSVVQLTPDKEVPDSTIHDCDPHCLHTIRDIHLDHPRRLLSLMTLSAGD